MRCVRVCVAAALAAALAVGGPRPSIADAKLEAAEDSNKDETDEENDEDADEQPAGSKPKVNTRNGGYKDWATSTPDRDVVAEHLLLFSGADIWRNGLFSHSGLFWAYRGLNADGPVLKMLLNGGLYRYRSDRRDIVGLQTMGTVLPGWRWHWPGLEVTVFAGLDAQDYRYLPDDRGNRLRGTRLGARGGFDAWYEPFANAMVTGSASLSTVGQSYWTRAAAGWRFFDMIWLGPEFVASGDDTYRQLRVGAHITGLRWSSYEFSAGAGWVTDSDRREGVYGRFGMIYRPFDRALQRVENVPF